MAHFDRFNFAPSIQKALLALQFKQLTPIQEKAIPVVLKGSDLIGTAQTGTGKTAAFCVPMLHHLLKSEKNALILTPTRELALQIEKFWIELTKFTPEILAVSLVGGVPMEKQIRKLKLKPRVLIATPGRLVDHLQRKSVSLADVSILVVDEGDRMLDMGFEAQLLEVVRLAPKNRQTLFFSATWSDAINVLSKKFLKASTYERVAAGETSQAATTVQQYLIATNEPSKRDLLLDEINAKQGTILVFARTQARTDSVCNYLESYGLEVNRLHGGRSQGQRSTALKQFREGKVRILVATDVAARGIDVAEIGHVINFDLPQIPEDYVHRIGRTGRAGSTGTATTFLTAEDADAWKEIAALLKKTDSKIPKAEKKASARPANIEDLESAEEEVKTLSRKPTRSHPGARRDNQWHKGTVTVKPEEEQRIKSGGKPNKTPVKNPNKFI